MVSTRAFGVSESRFDPVLPGRQRCSRGPELVGGAAGRGDAEHAHRLEAEREALAAVGRADVELGQLADAVEAVADRVAVGEEALGGPGDAAVGVEEGLERADQLGLVLVVVVDQRRDGLLVEALAARSGPRSSPAAAGGRRRSPRTRANDSPRASATFAASSASAPARWRSAGSVVGRLSATVSGVAGQARLELGQHRLRRRGRPASAPLPGTRITSSRSRARRAAFVALDAAAPAGPGDGRRQRRPLDRARAALGERQHPRAPVALLGVLRAGAHDDHAGAAAARSQPSSPARATMFSRSVSVRPSRSWRKSPTAASVARSGALRAIDLEADQRSPPSAAARARRLVAARPVAQLADGLRRPRAARPSPRPLAGHHRALVLGRGAGHREHAARPRRARSRWRRARAPRPARPRAARPRTRPPPRPRRARPGRSARRSPAALAAGLAGGQRRSGVAVVGPDDREADRGPMPSSVARMKSVRKPAATCSHTRP